MSPLMLCGMTPVLSYENPYWGREKAQCIRHLSPSRNPWGLRQGGESTCLQANTLSLVSAAHMIERENYLPQVTI